MERELHAVSARSAGAHLGQCLARASAASTTALAALLVMAALACASGSNGTRRESPGSAAQPASGGTAAAAGVGESGAGGQAAGAAGTAPGVTGTAGAAPASSVPAPDLETLLDASCASATVESRLVPTFLLIVLDRSGSMTCNPPPTTASTACEAEPVRADPALPSKWEIVQSALTAALTQLPQDVSAGVSYFSNDNACGVHADPAVPIAALDDVHRRAIEVSLDAVTPGGGTPMVGATILAYSHLHAEAVAGRVRGHKFVVLLTDGEQSEQCGDAARCGGAAACTDLLVSAEVPKAAGQGADIRTFVIGAPGSEPARTVLSQIAVAGGTAAAGCEVAQGNCHFDMTQRPDFAEALSQALAEIVGQALVCSLPVPVSADGTTDLTRVNVIYTPPNAPARVVPQDPNRDCAAGASGWQYAQDNREIRLCGAVCDEVRGGRSGRLDVVLGCPVQGPD